MSILDATLRDMGELNAVRPQEKREKSSIFLARVARWGRWLVPLVIAVELVLLFSGVLGVGTGVLVVAVVAGALLVLVAVEAWLVWRAVRCARARGAGGTDSLASSLRAVVPGWAASMVKHDLLMMRALWLAVRRKRDVPEDGEAIHYSGQLRPMMWVFFVLNPLEVVLVWRCPGRRCALSWRSSGSSAPSGFSH
ncbi:hypothetical protein [Saccharopolyspora shandongensis]|uniref:hypothetical protein n=1 Tax=Saccharopolyspora shandongensis TaxID=418495 RepID=UPI0033EE0146